MATMQEVRDWAERTLALVGGHNAIFAYTRRIENADQLKADFGTDTDDSDGFEITKGWVFKVTGRTTGRQATRQMLDTFTLRYQCLWSSHNQGASEADHADHVEVAANTLSHNSDPSSISGIVKVNLAQIETLENIEWSQREHHVGIIEQEIEAMRGV